MTDDKHRLLLDSLQEERDSQYLYRALEEKESGRAAKLFELLRIASEKQAGIWEERIREAGGSVPAFAVGLRVRSVGWLAGKLGASRMLPILAANKVRGLSIYRAPLEGSTEVEKRVKEESWHRGTQSGGSLRAAVFGVNDGLVSNASLIIGVAGASPEPRLILIAGVAGLLAGGFSMAAGEYVSMRTQREMFERQIGLEREELAVMPEEEVEELALIYKAKGLSPEEAHQVAARMVADPVVGLDTLAREELGLDPESLGSPVGAAIASFLSFAAGAVVPLLPYLFATGTNAFVGTVILTLLALALVGGSMSLFTGRNLFYSASRMALIGSLAAAATFLIGRLFGVATGG